MNLLINSMKQDPDIKAINQMEKEMDKENSFIKMEVTTKDNGKIIKWMDLEDSIMKEVNQHIRDIGLKINSTALEKFIMIIQLLYNVDLILLISIFSKIIGNTIKECWLRIRNKEGEKLN